MNPLIREGTENDIPAALKLVQELAQYEKAPEEVDVSEEQMKTWGFGKNPLFRFFVAELEGEILGMALYYYKYSTWKGKCIFLEDIIVTERHRKKNIGSRLFERVLQLAKEEQVKRLEWQVLNWNTPAIAFYKKYKSNFDEEWLNCKLTYAQLQSM